MEDHKHCGILICGLNGVGKSTLGKALAERLGLEFFDNENFYFPNAGTSDPFSVQRPRYQVERLLLQALRSCDGFIFASVKGDYGEEVCRRFTHAVLVEVPRDERLERVERRSFLRFGKRMREGGDMHESEERFFELVRSRPESTVTDWLSESGLRCPILRVDGRAAVGENVERIAEWLKTSAL